ncbi:MAG: hypothetical protein INR68_17560 [Methylobacterium mesophilicum]|nr:hypothetical protein [Methylobacterium mesophilicum]
MKTALVSAAVLAILGLSEGPAASANLEFAGTVLRTCSITVGAPGVLDVGANGTTLSSSSGLGTPATALVVSTGSNYQLSVTNPSSFSLAPSGGNAGVTFDTKYSVTGVTSALNVAAGGSTLLNIGTTNLSVSLTATKATVFPSGLYTAQTVVTCE